MVYRFSTVSDALYLGRLPSRTECSATFEAGIPEDDLLRADDDDLAEAGDDPEPSPEQGEEAPRPASASSGSAEKSDGAVPPCRSDHAEVRRLLSLDDSQIENGQVDEPVSDGQIYEPTEDGGSIQASAPSSGTPTSASSGDTLGRVQKDLDSLIRVASAKLEAKKLKLVLVRLFPVVVFHFFSFHFIMQVAFQARVVRSSK